MSIQFKFTQVWLIWVFNLNLHKFGLSNMSVQSKFIQVYIYIDWYEYSI